MGIHQIKNVTIDSVFPDHEQAKSFQEQVGPMMEESWQNSLAVWLDKLCQPDQNIIIDRLEIEAHFDGKTFDLRKWNESIVKLLKEKLQDELALKKYDFNENLSIISTHSSWLSQRIFYWKTGIIPWNAISIDFDTQILSDDIQLRKEEIISESASLLRLLSNKSFFVRCFTSMDEKAFEAFLLVLQPEVRDLPNHIESVRLIYHLMFPGKTSRRDIAILLAELWSWIAQLKSTERPLSPKQILGFLYHLWQSKSGRVTLSRPTDKKVPGTLHDFLQKLLVLSESQLPGNWTESIRQIILENDLVIPEFSIPPVGQKQLEDASDDLQRFEQEREDGTKNRAVQRENESESLCEDAGVVLLHPFIQMLFAESMIIQKDGAKLLLPDLAVQALHYLVYGDAPFHAHRLATIRCLCGLDADDVLQEIELPASLKSECDGLMSSVVNHWKILKKTSVEGLRLSFLQRKGLILDKDDHYKLKVEKQSYDLLLDHLPWSYSIVKLPWMLKPMYVQWHNSM